MLQRVQSQIRHLGGFRVRVDSHYAAFFAEFIQFRHCVS